MSGRRKVTLHGGNTIIEANKASKGTVFSRLGSDRSGESGRKVRHSSPPRRKPTVVTVPELEPCRMWEKTGDCPYGNNCKNAHPEKKKKSFSDSHGGDRVINIDAVTGGPAEKPWHKQTTRTISNDDAGHLRAIPPSDRGRSPPRKRKRYGSGVDSREGGGGLDEGGRRGLTDSKLRTSQDDFPDAKRRHRSSFDERLEAGGSHVDSIAKHAGADIAKRVSADGMSKRPSSDKSSRRVDHSEHFKGERLERTISTKSHHASESGGRSLSDRHASSHASSSSAMHPYDGFPASRRVSGSAEASPHRAHSSRVSATAYPHHSHSALPGTSPSASAGGSSGGGHSGHHSGARHDLRHDHSSHHAAAAAEKARSSHAEHAERDRRAEGAHSSRGRHADHLNRGGRHAEHFRPDRDRHGEHSVSERDRHLEHSHSHRDRHASSSKYIKSPDGHQQRVRPDVVRDSHGRSQDRQPSGQHQDRARGDAARDRQSSSLALPRPAAASSRTGAGSRDATKTDKRSDYRSRESSSSRGSAQRSMSAESRDRHRGSSSRKRRDAEEALLDVPIVIDAVDEGPLAPANPTGPQQGNVEDDVEGSESAGPGSASLSGQESDDDSGDESADVSADESGDESVDLELADWSPSVEDSGSEEVMSPQRTDVVYEVSDEVVGDDNEMDLAPALEGFEAEDASGQGDGVEVVDEAGDLETSPAPHHAAASAAIMARTSSSESSPRRRTLRAVVVKKLSMEDIHRLVDSKPGPRSRRSVGDGYPFDDISISPSSSPRNRQAERAEHEEEVAAGDGSGAALLYDEWDDEGNDAELLGLLYADGPVDDGTGVMVTVPAVVAPASAAAAAAAAAGAAAAAAAALPGDAGTVASAACADAGDAAARAAAVADSQVLLYEDMDALSDDEDLNAILQAEGVRTDSTKTGVELAGGDLPVAGASVEDVDWSVLAAQESEDGPAGGGAASPDASDACLQRFTADSVFASCGISLQLAGKDVFSAVAALVGDGDSDPASWPLTSTGCGALMQARWERIAASGQRRAAVVTHRTDGCALTARRDLEIRRQLKLVNDSKVMLSQTASAIPGDGAYLRPSLELYHRRSILTPGGSQPKILPSAVGTLLST